MTRAPRPALALLVLVLGTVLFVGSRAPAGPEAPAARSERLAAKVRCPTCNGLSAAESDAAASVAVREEIDRRVAAGEDDGTILRFFVARYGEDILLTPPASGLGAVVWALPVVALVLALAGLAVAFGRWRARARGQATDEDRELVARALGR